MAKRSATFKQFLLRVHPDHFRRLPHVHDENLQSIQLLNQFMDERSASSAWSTLRGGSSASSSTRKVHFSVYLASPAPAPATSQSAGQEQERKLKRFSLALSTNIESHMQAILRECGVAVPDAEQTASHTPTGKVKDARRARERTRRQSHTPRRREREDNDMDFGSSMHDMYETLRAQSVSAARRKRPILSMKDFLAFVAADETRAVEQQRYSAWLSIQSVKATLQREFGLGEVATSCGWAAVHLNATLMVLLKTLRKYTRAQGRGPSGSLFTPSALLHGACIDISSEPSGIDVHNEYRVHLNPTDVPLQWIKVLERIDDAMLEYMRAARASLAGLQTAATAALGDAAIRRGHTCPALSYRGFLQAMTMDSSTRRHERPSADRTSVCEQLTLVVEDQHYAWRVLRDGSIQVPSDATLDDVAMFLASHRSQIHEQRTAHDTKQHELAQIVAMCTHALGVKTITHADSVPVEDAMRACEELLALAAQVHMGTVARDKVPPELSSGVNRDLGSFLRGRRVRIARSFGLDQDGSVTIPFDWFA